MTKQKTRKELEREKERFRKSGLVFAIALIVSLLILCFVLGFFQKKVEKLQTQLSECQEQVPVWTLKINCTDFFGVDEAIITHNFSNYTKYKNTINNLFKNCEVIE